MRLRSKKNDEPYFKVMTGRGFERQLCLENKGKCQFEVDNKMGWGEIMLNFFRSFLIKFFNIKHPTLKTFGQILLLSFLIQ